jgi:GTP-binding protein LepA
MISIRNFAIIAHVDHGKSTLADRFLEITGVVKAGGHEEQFLDRNPISRERGITIKLAPVRMTYQYKVSGIKYLGEKKIEPLILDTKYFILNLIDTPGHVDFSYEVDRTLACVEGVILLVDATQGVQAQTIANAYKALDKNLVIIPVINKIDMPSADPIKTKKQLTAFLGVKEEEIFEVSAKTGEGVPNLLTTVVEKIPAPINKLASNLGLSALIFDSYYDTHRGVIAFIRVFNGEVKKGTKVRLCNGGDDFIIGEVGVFNPELEEKESLVSGEIGYIVTNLKDIHQVRVGDTVVGKNDPINPLPGYKKIRPMVFASIFTTDTGDYLNLKKALEKLYLNDSSLESSAIYSKSLGAGFRVGFLGLLHADVVRERLEREFNLSLLLTPPQVEYKIENGVFHEPYVKLMILTPNEYLGAVMKLCEDYRAKFITMDNKNQISLYYEMPMSEMIADFFDNLKSVSSGYASLDWEFLRYVKVDADRLIILLNNDEVAEFSEIIVKERAQQRAFALTKKLKEIIPRQQYEVKIQGKYKGKIIASERVAPYRKDVTGKLYGGDRTRKDKLLEKQKEGKKKLKMIGKVEIPKESFMKLFRRN